MLVTAEEDRQQALLTRHVTSFRQLGQFYRRDHEVHRLRLLPRSQVVSCSWEIGFQVQTVGGYGSVPFAPGHVGFLGRKPRVSKPQRTGPNHPMETTEAASRFLGSLLVGQQRRALCPVVR